MVAALSVGAFAVPASAATVSPENVLAKPTVKYDHKHGGAFDLGIANDERLIEMLKKEGKIKKNATAAEAEKALKSYLKVRAENTGKTKDKLPKGLDAKIKDSDKKSTGNGLVNGKGNKLGQAKKNQPDGVEKEAYNGEVREDKVLVLAIEFPDYEKSSITEDETDMFYEDYTHEHFQDMIFGDEGYEGPNGENLVSMKQYYEQQSGGSYSVDGTVAGWYTADHPAAYYGGHGANGGNDVRPRELVYEALKKAGQDDSVDLSEYDVWDRDDYDGDGVYNEPDGIIDHLMVIHAGVGEEAGGGKLGEDAIWSHRWNLGGLIAVPGGESNSDRFGGLLGAFDYTIEPEDGAAGVFAHEYGHDLGLPDEYDTQYSGAGEAVSYWSIMASGSWAGKVPGTEPSGFSAWSKEFLQANHGGNWLSGSTYDLEDINSAGTEILLDEAVTKGKNNDAVRINLPKKEVQGIKPAFGEKYYYSTKGDDLNTKLVSPEFDLTNATTASFDFKTLFEVEYDYDYLYVTAKTASGEEVELDVIGDEDTNGDATAETTNGKWVDKSYDLSQFAGEKVTLEFNYVTDGGLALNGFALDNVALTVDGNVVFEDGAEGEPQFEMDGFVASNGIDYKDHYYLLEWRSHNGVDEGLANIRRGESLMEYNEGLVVWYVDNSFSDNWTGKHPGDGYLGVVDADQKANYWSDGTVGSTRYQIHDAAFSLDKSEKMFLDYTDLLGITMKDNHTARNPLFDDSADYSNKALVDAGRNVPNYGLKFRVTGESADGTVGKVLLYKK
ncbi:immune inhibitor A domain-containing protein [Rossellomorea vietnamensis]